MCRAFIIILHLCFVINIQAQKSQEWRNRLDSLSQERDVNKKIYQLNQIAIDLKELLKSRNAEEVAAMSDKVYSARSGDGKVELLAFGEYTYPGRIQLEWLIKENFTGTESVWIFEDEVTVKPLKSGVKLSVDLRYDEGRDLYQAAIFGVNGTQYIQITDLMTKCWFEKLFQQKTNESKDSINGIIIDRLNKLWREPSFFSNELEGLKRMKTIISKDKKVKLCTYNIQNEGFVHMFYGAVITKENGEVLVYHLNDQTEAIRSPERSTLTNRKWYGAVYLDIVEATDKNKTYYTLLGYKGHDEFVKTRVIDVLVIQNKRIKFGAPVFKTDRITRQRLVYHYSAGATMMMRYDNRMKMIVMDNLVPTESFYRGVYRFYGPDFSYNGLKFEKGYWQLSEDVDLRNPKSN